jgi:uncharacterized protein DUF4157
VERTSAETTEEPAQVRAAGRDGLPAGLRPARLLALQRSAGNAAVARALARGGQRLDGATRARISGAFGGADVGEVRVHTDATSAGAVERAGARAVAMGEDIAFAPGEFRPGTPIGDALLAHEVAHVLQQRGSEAAATAGRAELEHDANRSASGAVARLWSGAVGWATGVARDARPRLRSGLALRACIRGCSSEEERRVRSLAEELLDLHDADAIADRLGQADRPTLDIARRALEDSDGAAYRDTIQARALAWELAWRDHDWSRMVALSTADAHGLRAPYRTRIVTAVMGGSLTVRATGGSADWRDWVQQRLLDLTERAVGFRVLVELLATAQQVTLQSPSTPGGGHETQRISSEQDPDAGRYDRAAGHAGHATGSTITLDKSVAANQVVLGGAASAPQLLDADETVTVGHELIHALHNARGESLAPSAFAPVLQGLGKPSDLVRDPLSGEPMSAEELWTVEGRTSFRAAIGDATFTAQVRQTPSENDLRRERGLPLRQSHYGGLAQFSVRVAGGESVGDVVAQHYQWRAPVRERHETAPTDALKARVLAAVTQMVAQQYGTHTIPAGLAGNRIPLPHPQTIVLRLRFINPQPDLVDAAGFLEPRP